MPRATSTSPSSRRRTVTTKRLDIASDASPSIFDHSHTAYHRRSLSQHGAHITMLWVVLLSFSLAGAMMIMGMATRLSSLERRLPQISDLQKQLEVEEQRLAELVEVVKLLVPPSTPVPVETVSSTTSTVPPSIAPAPPVSMGTASPSGALSRGALSPDGSKFAGYEDVKVGKKGIAVELLNTTTARKERYIVIFSASESTGIGTEFEKQMSVRWKDKQTIEYDVLVKKGTGWVIETREVQIYI